MRGALFSCSAVDFNCFLGPNGAIVRCYGVLSTATVIFSFQRIVFEEREEFYAKEV